MSDLLKENNSAEKKIIQVDNVKLNLCSSYVLENVCCGSYFANLCTNIFFEKLLIFCHGQVLCKLFKLRYKLSFSTTCLYIFHFHFSAKALRETIIPAHSTITKMADFFAATNLGLKVNLHLYLAQLLLLVVPFLFLKFCLRIWQIVVKNIFFRFVVPDNFFLAICHYGQKSTTSKDFAKYVFISAFLYLKCEAAN